MGVHFKVVRLFNRTCENVHCCYCSLCKKESWMTDTIVTVISTLSLLTLFQFLSLHTSTFSLFNYAIVCVQCIFPSKITDAAHVPFRSGCFVSSNTNPFCVHVFFFEYALAKFPLSWKINCINTHFVDCYYQLSWSAVCRTYKMLQKKKWLIVEHLVIQFLLYETWNQTQTTKKQDAKKRKKTFCEEHRRMNWEYALASLTLFKSWENERRWWEASSEHIRVRMAQYTWVQQL